MLQRTRSAQNQGGSRSSIQTPPPGPASVPSEGTDTTWQLAADLGRRYAAVSGDRNPIHMHPLPARALGFPGAIAHGMWTMARILASLAGELPDSYAVEVSFRSPIVLPAAVGFTCRALEEGTELWVHSRDMQCTHLRGCVRPLSIETVTAIRKGVRAT